MKTIGNSDMIQPAHPDRHDSLLRHTPNTITTARIVIAALFPFCPESWHLPLVLAGLATEFLDGFIARLFRWTSYLGQVLDPVADKLFVLSVSLTWIVLGKITLWQWLLLAVRDFGVLFIFLALLAMGRVRTIRSVKARIPSKLTTALQYGVFLLVLTDRHGLVQPLVIAAGLTGLVAALQYVYLVRQALGGSVPERTSQ